MLATNHSYRRVSIERGARGPRTSSWLRNGPDLERFRRVPQEPELRRGRKHLIAYLGITGSQDGVDHAVSALAWLRGVRDDWHAVFIGEETCSKTCAHWPSSWASSTPSSSPAGAATATSAHPLDARALGADAIALSEPREAVAIPPDAA